jgi:hypothetical protein
MRRFTAAARQIASKLRSYALRAESKARGLPACPTGAMHLRFCPKGVGVRLADEAETSICSDTAHRKLRSNSFVVAAKLLSLSPPG